MKKVLVLMFALCMTVALIACNTFVESENTESTSVPEIDQKNPQADNLSEYLKEEDGKQYLILPISKCKVFIPDKYKDYLDNIDVELLKASEEKISGEISQYSSHSDFYLQLDEGFLCLCAEVIEDINPPNTVTDNNGEAIVDGCDIDHRHIFFSERITK